MWFKVDDQFWRSKKVLRVTRKQRCAAIGLWALAGSWSGHELTSGFIPEYMIDELGGDQKTVDVLIKARLWDRVADGYQFHDWEKYNPSKEEVEALKTERSAAAVYGNHVKWHASKGIMKPGCKHCNTIPNLSQRRSQL